MRATAFLTALAIGLCGLTARADVYFTGDTSGAPTFHRAYTLTQLSGVGTATAYIVQPFYTTSNQSGAVFEVNGLTLTDTFAYVYSGNFDPHNALLNLLDGDDDFNGAFSVLTGTGQGLASSRIASGESTNLNGGAGLTLTANTQYFAVVTGYGNTDIGSFNAGIGGVDLFLGTVAIPEPSAAWIFIVAGTACGLMRRCRL